MNLDAYFNRIQFTDKPSVSLEVLREISCRHACSIPFENLDIPLGKAISLDANDVETKLISNNRGGYCFEQNFLLMRVLQQIGFEVFPLSARVRIGATRDFIPARTHLFLKVELNGEAWLADVGIGSLSLTTPIRIDVLNVEQSTMHETRRILREDRLPFPVYYHQAKLGEQWSDVYEFTLEEMPEIDRELGNWWTSTSPNSKFSKNLFAALARPDGTRISINNQEFTHRRNTDILEQFEISNNRQMIELLAERFNLSFPKETLFLKH